MRWSFPALLDIDGVVLEDGFELDKEAASLIALTEYVDRTGDLEFLRAHRNVLTVLREKVEVHYDSKTGLYSLL